ncbi:MAG: cobalamin biosynthesis protein [Candidatus Omnitrophica bacterium]|nr:cobalamin biosynthesis protein [Candidatus Omnitrophota bacterium]
MTIIKKLWLGIVVLIILTPLGLILPHYFHTQDAWGEWDPDQLKNMIGYIPQGIARLADIWKAPLPDYNFKGGGNMDMPHQCMAYVISAIIGIALISGLVFFLGKVWSRNND